MAEKQEDNQANQAQQAQELDEKTIENLLNSQSSWGNKARELASLLKDLNQIQPVVAGDDIFNTLLKIAMLKMLMEPDPNKLLIQYILSKSGKDGNSAQPSPLAQVSSSIRALRTQLDSLKELAEELNSLSGGSTEEIAKMAAEEALRRLSPEAIGNAVEKTINYKTRVMEMISTLLNRVADAVLEPLLRGLTETYLQQSLNSHGSGAIDAVLQQLGGSTQQNSGYTNTAGWQGQGGVSGGNTAVPVQSNPTNTGTEVRASSEVGGGAGSISQPKPPASANQGAGTLRPKVDFVGAGVSQRRVVNRGGDSTTGKR